MCNERRYHYIALIGKVNDEEIKRIAESIKEKCPEKLIRKANKVNSEMEIWRFIKGVKDKYPYFICAPKLYKKRAKKKIPACLGCGLSVFPSKEAVINIINEKLPKQKYKLVRGKYRPDKGDLYKTGADRHHYTFFPCEGFNHDEFFEEVEEIWEGRS